MLSELLHLGIDPKRKNSGRNGTGNPHGCEIDAGAEGSVTAISYHTSLSLGIESCLSINTKGQTVLGRTGGSFTTTGSFK